MRTPAGLFFGGGPSVWAGPSGQGALPMKRLLLAAIAVAGLAGACTIKRDADQQPAPDRPPVVTPAPESWILNPPNDRPK